MQALRFPLEWMDDSCLHALGSRAPEASLELANAKKQQCTRWLASLAVELKAGMRGGLETLDLGSPKAEWHSKPAPSLKLGALPTALPRLRHLHAICTRSAPTSLRLQSGRTPSAKASVLSRSGRTSRAHGVTTTMTQT